MATLEDLSRMAMVEVGEDTKFPPTVETSETGWGKMALMLAASAAVCGLVVGIQRSRSDENPR